MAKFKKKYHAAISWNRGVKTNSVKTNHSVANKAPITAPHEICAQVWYIKYMLYRIFTGHNKLFFTMVY